MVELRRRSSYGRPHPTVVLAGDPRLLHIESLRLWRQIGVIVAAFLWLAACAPAPAPTTTPVPPATATTRPTPIPTPTPTPALPGWEWVWSDEFDGPTLNPDNWLAETGAGGWGNNELQFYTDRPENLRLENGLLVIEARKEDYRGSRYTSARIKTESRRVFRYGRIEARLKLPTGKGIWPAFWMLGENLPTAGWPAAGEIDIMENIGEPHTIYGTVHGPGYAGAQGVGASYTLGGDPLYQNFHTYAIEWTPTEIRWYLDETLFNIVRETDVPGPWVFDHPFFILLNVAVGGNWPGHPDESTAFPQQMVVDYVRVYRDPNLILRARPILHAADIRLSLTPSNNGTQAEAWVRVTDENEEPVEGAIVRAGWLGVVHGATVEATTDADGLAGPFTGRMVSTATEVSFCISEIRKAEADYDKSRNVATCAFQTR